MFPPSEDEAERRPLNADNNERQARNERLARIGGLYGASRFLGDWRGFSAAVTNFSGSMQSAFQEGASQFPGIRQNADEIDSDGGVGDPPVALAMRTITGANTAGTNNNNNNGDDTTTTTRQNANNNNNNAPDLASDSPDSQSSVTRWIEDTMPFVTLLVMVFLYKHLLSLLTFFWLTSILHHANERMRRQSLLREQRSRQALLGVILLLCCELSCLSLLQGHRLGSQLSLLSVTDFSADPPNLTTILWDVALADLAARSLLMLLKAVIFLSMPLRVPARRLRNGFTTIELAGACYRLLLPMPLWFHYLAHVATDDESSSVPSLWSVGVSHLYAGFKFVAVFERLRRAGKAMRVALWSSLPVGKYASEEELLELGEDGCTICQETHAQPVRLACGHIFCEE